MKLALALAVFCLLYSIEPAMAEDSVQCAGDELRLLAKFGIFLLVAFTLAHTFFYKRRAVKKGLPESYGITGWLLYFILISFFSYLFQAVTLVGEAMESISGSPSEYVFGVTLLYSVDLLVVLVSLYALFMLWKLKHRAVLVNKVILVVSPLYILISPVLGDVIAALTMPGVGFDSINVRESYDIDTFVFSMQSAIFSVVWFCYFSFSKRVKCTYGVQ